MATEGYTNKKCWKHGCSRHYTNDLGVRLCSECVPKPASTREAPPPDTVSVRAAAENFYRDLLAGHPEMNYNARDVDALERLILGLGAAVPVDDRTVLDEMRLKAFGWVAIGNTWYPPAMQLPKLYHHSDALALWCRVDGTLRLPGSHWMSEQDITVGRFKQVCSTLGVTLPALLGPKGGT